jgi:hypothetical protein
LLKGPGGDEVYLLPPLTLHSLHHLGVLETLAALMHLWIDISHTILQPFYLFQFVMQLLLQLAVLVHLRTESVVSETSQRVVDPIFTHVVMVEDSHPSGCSRHDLIRCDARGGVSRSTIDGGSRGSHAQGIGVIGHVDGDVLGFYLAPIIHNFEGDVTQGNVEPELLWYVQSWLRVRGRRVVEGCAPLP